MNIEVDLEIGDWDVLLLLVLKEKYGYFYIGVLVIVESDGVVVVGNIL